MDDKIAKRITHEEYIKMYETVKDSCLLWAVKLRDGIGERFSFSDKVSVSKYFLKEMREAARTEGTQKHIDVLNEVFGKEKPKPKFKKGHWVRTTEFTRVCRVEDINSFGYKLKGLNGGDFSVGEEYIIPWIPEVGDWVVADGKEGAMQIFNIIHSVNSTYYLERKREDGYTECLKYSIEYLRPATKEEIAEAKVEGEMFFTKKGLGILAEIIRRPENTPFHIWDKIPREWSRDKAEWINKVLTKALKTNALKDEGK